MKARKIYENIFSKIITDDLIKRINDIAVKPVDIKILVDFFTHG